MNEENGKNSELSANSPYKIFENPFQEISINTINEKLKKKELSIEDFLCNNRCIEDLKTNPRSKYKKLLTMDNIKKLISFSIYPPQTNLIISYETLRFPYYSCDLLCSPCILQFSKSLENIKKANGLINKSKETSEIKNTEESKEKTEEKNILDENDFNEQDDYFNQVDNQEQTTINEYGDNFFGDRDNDHEEFMNFDMLQEKETEFQKGTMEEIKKSQYDEVDNGIIKEILDAIFYYLDIKSHLDETYVGYFQKMVNYLLINEPNVTEEYLFRYDCSVIKKFYNHINNASIENTLENILNYLSDKETHKLDSDKSKFNMIIMELLEEIEKRINKEYNINNEENIESTEDKNTIEFICELIINTLINNTIKNLIELVFKSKGIFMQKMIVLIEKSVNLEYKYEINNKKYLIINLIKILRQINSVIMNSKNIILNTNCKDNLYLFKDPYKKIKTFENQYFCIKSFNQDDISKAFEENSATYIQSIKKIYDLIKNDIIKNTNLEYDKKNKKEKGKTLMLINEWKYIFSGLKIFIFQFYAIENFKMENDTEDFYDKKLFDLSLKYFFKFEENNIYQRIFIDIIRIISFERVPNYLIQYFIQIQNIFIEKIITLIESKDKYNLLIGPIVQILIIIYTSSNPALINFYQDEINSKEKIYRDEFLNIIKPKFERKLNEKYEYTLEEIFSDAHDKDDTFDGNDIKYYSKIKLDSFRTVISNYLNKLNFNKNSININNFEDKMSDNQCNNANSTQTEKTTEDTKKLGNNITMVESTTYTVGQENGGNQPFTGRRKTFGLK